MKGSDAIMVPEVSSAVSPWKSCDLRGIYPHSISVDLFEGIGSAVGTMLPRAARVLVSGDFRLSTPTLKQAMIKGLVRTGVTVLDAGQAPTPVAYFTSRRLQADAVLIITASHNPASHNGLKLMIGEEPTTPSQLNDIRTAVCAAQFRNDAGVLEHVDLIDLYEQSIVERWSHLNPKRFSRVVLDAGNGAWSDIAPRIFQRLGYTVECISCVADGRFPDRPSDCSRTANLSALRVAVAKQPNSIGIAWDGDGDRVAFVDETGTHLSADEISILLAREVLHRGKTQSKIVVDIKLSAVVGRDIVARGGSALLERTGHAFMRSRMVAEDALLGLDACGHYFYRELGGGDDGLFSAFFVLDLLQQADKPLSELRLALPRIYSTPELRIPADLLSFADAVERLNEAFSVVEISRIDGIRMLLLDGTILIRESGTEPVVSLRIEGYEQSSYKHLVDKCLGCLPDVEPFLRLQLSEQTQS